MNQLKIGQFIATLRKSKKYTQRELSEIIGVTDKTISKWECGNGLPEVSLMIPLCEALEITVNDLLTGNRVSESDYKTRAEENMITLMKQNEENKRNWKNMIVMGTVTVVSFLTLIIIVAIYAQVMSLPAKIIIIGIACAIFIIGLLPTMQLERTIGYYNCKHCNAFFVPTFKQYIFGLHMLSTRKLQCPSCGKKDYCKKVVAKDE